MAKQKEGVFFILGFNMLKPNMSNTISIGTCSSDLYIDKFLKLPAPPRAALLVV